MFGLHVTPHSGLNPGSSPEPRTAHVTSGLNNVDTVPAENKHVKHDAT